MNHKPQPPWTTKTILVCSLLFSPFAGGALAHESSNRIRGHKSVTTPLVLVCGYFALLISLTYVGQNSLLSLNQLKVIAALSWLYFLVHITLAQRRLLNTFHVVEYDGWPSAVVYAMRADVIFALAFVGVQIFVQTQSYF